MEQFLGSLRKISLTGYMNYIERGPNANKAQIKQQFLSFFKTLDEKYLAAKKLKDTTQKSTEIFQEYDKKFKYLLSRIEYYIEYPLLIQWLLAGLLQRIIMHIQLCDFNTYEEALNKEL